MRFTLCLMFLLGNFVIAQDSQTGLDKALDSRGRIREGIKGSFDASGYQMKLGARGEPVFSKSNSDLSSNLAAASTALAGSWDTRFFQNGFDNTVYSVAVIGADTYVGGSFTAVNGDASIRYLAKWNGTTWSSGGGGVNGIVHALKADGTNLYVGGEFTQVGGSVNANKIAMWNGTTWSALGNGVTSGLPGQGVYTIAIKDTDVYIGGQFTEVDFLTMNYIAKWNGTTWSKLGTGGSNGTNGNVNGIGLVGNKVFAGGNFTTAGGSSANYAAVWNGSSWSALGSGLSGGFFGFATSVGVVGTRVYYGGYFTTAGGTSANHVAYWDTTNSQWSALSAGTDQDIQEIAINDTDVYVGGNFSTVDGSISSAGVAKWNGSTWSAIDIGVGQTVYALAISGTTIWAGGSFVNLVAGGNANRFAKWNGAIWSAVGESSTGLGVNGTVHAVAVSGSDVYIGGSFSKVGNVTARNVAKWNGTSWSGLGTGVSLYDAVYAITVMGTDIYFGGSITQAGGVSSPGNIAKWNGSSWSALGSGVGGPDPNQVWALANDGTNIYAGGNFTTAGGSPANRIAKWNGSSWSALGNGVDNVVNAIAASGSDVYAGGAFLNVDGIPMNRIAKWNGSSWSALGNGVNQLVYSLAISGTNLYAGGYFDTAGTVAANHIAKWNGTTWSALASGVGASGNSVLSISINSGILYAGSFNALQEWNGVGWTSFGSVDDALKASAVGNDKLYIGGYFTTAPSGSPVSSHFGIFNNLATAPSAPTGLAAATQSASQINLSWNQGTSGVPTSYRIFRSTSNGVVGVQIDSVNAPTTTYNDTTGLSPSTTYYYTVFAVNAVGMSPGSNQANATTQATGYPSAPTSLSATAQSFSQINLSWTASTIGSPTKYRIYRSTSSGLVGAQVDSVNAPTVAYNDINGLSPTTTYYYVVFAVNAVGMSSASNQATATTQAPTLPSVPTNLSATAQSSSQINLSWTASGSGSPTKYRIHRSITSNSGFVQVDSVNSSATTYNNIGLSPLTTYYFRIYAANAFGASNASNTASAMTPAVAPTISSLQISPPVVVAGSDATVSVNVSQPIKSVTIEYKKGKLNFGTPSAMTGAGGVYSATIPGIDITTLGVIFKITAIDSFNSTTVFISSFPITVTANSVKMADSGSAYVLGFPTKQWRMISVPLDLDDKTVGRVLNDLGAPSQTTWRLFNDQSEASTRTDGIFELGKSFWLQQSLAFPQTLSLGAGRVAGNQVAITLQPGWNQIADPYPYPIDWATDTDAPSKAQIKGPIKYTGDHYIGIGQVAPDDGTAFTELQPWDGYWVYNGTGAVATLTVSPSRSLSKGTGKTVHAQEIQSGWKINFSAQAGKYSDVYNYVGTAADASDFEDRYDLPELPVIGDYVSVSFDHVHENGNDYSYTIDYKNTTDQGYSWDMQVESNIHDKPVKLNWLSEALPENYKIGILDISNNKEVASTDYKFAIKYDQPIHFRIFVGTAEYVDAEMAKTKATLPGSFVLGQNYPNPFNPTTVISYQLPMLSRIQLKIYNLLGQEVRTLIPGAVQDPGKYEIFWDGRNERGVPVASGVYIYRLRTNEFIQSKKMLLIR